MTKEEHTHLREAGAAQLQPPNARANSGAVLSGHFLGPEEPKSKFHVK